MSGFVEITLIDGRATTVYANIDTQSGETFRIYTELDQGLILFDDDGEECVFELIPTQNPIFGSVSPGDFKRFYELAPKNGLFGVENFQEDIEEYGPGFYSEAFWKNPIVATCCHRPD